MRITLLFLTIALTACLLADEKAGRASWNVYVPAGSHR